MKWGKVEFKELERLAKAFQKATDERVIERFIRDFLTEMALRSIRKIKRRTPKDTGLLQNAWQISRIERKGNAYEVTIYNNTPYAEFVEFGHRIKSGYTKSKEDGKHIYNENVNISWVPGRFMATISMKEIEKELPRYLERRQMELLNDIMNGRPAKKG